MLKNLANHPVLKRLLLTLLLSVLAALGVQDIDPSNKQSIIAGCVAAVVSIAHMLIEALVNRLKAKESPELISTLQQLHAALLENRQRVNLDTVEAAEKVAQLVRERSNPPPPAE